LSNGISSNSIYSTEFIESELPLSELRLTEFTLAALTAAVRSTLLPESSRFGNGTIPALVHQVKVSIPRSLMRLREHLLISMGRVPSLVMCRACIVPLRSCGGDVEIGRNTGLDRGFKRDRCTANESSSVNGVQDGV
jgi:hypothetical protein